MLSTVATAVWHVACEGGSFRSGNCTTSAGSFSLRSVHVAIILIPTMISIILITTMVSIIANLIISIVVLLVLVQHVSDDIKS